MSESASLPVRLTVTLMGVGHIPAAPGTLASLLCLFPGALILQLGGPPALILATGLVFLLGVWTCGLYETATGRFDPPEVVIDEVPGQWLALMVVPLTPLGVAAAFLAFRLFDIVKPWPISWFDRNIKGGFGVMLDDLLAGVAAAILLAVLDGVFHVF